LHSTTTDVLVNTFREEDCVSFSPSRRSCYVKHSLTGVLFPPDKEGGRTGYRTELAADVRQEFFIS